MPLVLIIGLNPMLLYDADYSAWIDIIGNRTLTSLALCTGN